MPEMLNLRLSPRRRCQASLRGAGAMRVSRRWWGLPSGRRWGLGGPWGSSGSRASRRELIYHGMGPSHNFHVRLPSWCEE